MSDNHYRHYRPHPHSYPHNPPSLDCRDQNPYSHQRQHQHQHQQQYQHPSQHQHIQHQRYLSQQEHQQYHHPHPASHRHHPIPHTTVGSCSSNNNDSRGSNSNCSGNKRPGQSLSTSSPSSSQSTSNVNIVATPPPSSSSLSSPANTASTGSGGTTRSNKKARKSSSSNVRTSPTGESTKSTGSGTGTTSAARGLRHFSMMVCQKVEEKGTTTYNEVADELVKKVVAERRREDPNGKFDEKNIRRRVYDALNVLMAMDIISKEKKEITWNGLPTAAKQDMDSMKKEIEYREYQIEQKRESLRDLLIQQVCFRNLVQRNHKRGVVPDEKIPLPFIVVNTNQSAVIQCDMSGDRTDVMFDFSLPFEINDDNTILKKMLMDRTSMSTLRQMLPEDLLQYCETNRLVDEFVGRGNLFDDKPEELTPPEPSTSSSSSETQQKLPPNTNHRPSPSPAEPAVIASSGSSVASSSMSRHNRDVYY